MPDFISIPARWWTRRQPRLVRKASLEWEKKEPAEQKAWQFQKLKECLYRAKNNVPWYQKNLSEINIIDIQNIEDFQIKVPLLDRPAVKAAPDQFVSNKTKSSNLTPVRTGGSSGTPMLFYLDHEARLRQKADMYRGRMWWGFQPHEDRHIILWGHGASFAPGWPGHKAKLVQRIKDHLLGRLRISAYDMARAKTGDHLKNIAKVNPHYIQGYASALELIANYIVEDNIRPSLPALKAIISTAEPLIQRQLTVLKKAFGVPIINEYGCSEVGIIGYSCPICGCIHTMDDHLFVEVLNSQCVNGHLLGELAVTTFLHHSAPLIRYRLGDLAELSDDHVHCLHGVCGIKRIYGRTHDRIVTPSGDVVHGEFFTHILDHVQGVSRFQVVQESYDRLRLVIVKELGWRETAETRITSLIRKKFGKNVSVFFDYRKDIPLTPSGKFRWVISNVQ